MWHDCHEIPTMGCDLICMCRLLIRNKATPPWLKFQSACAVWSDLYHRTWWKPTLDCGTGQLAASDRRLSRLSPSDCCRTGGVSQWRMIAVTQADLWPPALVRASSRRPCFHFQEAIHTAAHQLRVCVLAYSENLRPPSFTRLVAQALAHKSINWSWLTSEARGWPGQVSGSGPRPGRHTDD